MESVLHKYFGKEIKLPVPEDALFLHNRTFSEVEAKARKVKLRDRERFTNAEFLAFWKMGMSLS